MKQLDRYDDEELWHPSGWSPVYDVAVASPRYLVGFCFARSLTCPGGGSMPHSGRDGWAQSSQ
jgi:hypothetical protein